MKPGLAKDWFTKFQTDVYPHDKVVIRGGRICKPPRYYDKLYRAAAVSAGSWEIVAQVDSVFDARVEKAILSLDDNTPDRLLVKEQVTKAKLSMLKRNL